MTLGLVITVATLVLTLTWIAVDLLKPRKTLPPLAPLCPANGKVVLDGVADAERRFMEKALELEELRQKAGIMKAASDLKRTGDHLPGTDTAVVKAIDMKLEMARHLTAKKKA